MKLTFSKRILLNNLFYLIPIIVLMYLTYNGFSKDINFANREIAGAQIEKDAIDILSKLVFSKNNLSELIKADTELLEINLTQNETLLKFDEKNLKEKNKANLKISDFIIKLKKIELNNSNEIVANINELINYTGDSSNLILDPDLDSYYLMDLNLYALPNLINRLNEIKITLDSKPLNQEKLNSLIAIVKEIDLPRLKTDIDTALVEDKNFNGINDNFQKFGNKQIYEIIVQLRMC